METETTYTGTILTEKVKKLTNTQIIETMTTMIKDIIDGVESGKLTRDRVHSLEFEPIWPETSNNMNEAKITNVKIKITI